MGQATPTSEFNPSQLDPEFFGGIIAMTIEEALMILDSLLGRKNLTHLQEEVFCRSWEGQTYQEIAANEIYDADYVKLVGSQLWQTLSDLLGQKVTKNNFRVVLRQWAMTGGGDEERAAPADEDQPGWESTETGLRISAARNPVMLPLGHGVASPFLPLSQDWGEAVDTSIFFGRIPELTELATAITHDRCRLVAILGMGGIGKTVLAIRLAQQLMGQTEAADGDEPEARSELSVGSADLIHSKGVASPFQSVATAVMAEMPSFDCVIWRSLRDAPPIQQILTDLIYFFSQQQETELPVSVEGKLGRVMHYLRQRRCLIIFDNVESILSDRLGHYLPGYEPYGELLRRIGAMNHPSCLVLTSREPPKEVIALAGQGAYDFRLMGLDQNEAKELLAAKQLTVNPTDFDRLLALYDGNPLALKIAATTIQEIFDGAVAEFLAQDTAVFGGIAELLDQQFQRLSPLERQVMYWLAINREGIAIAELAADLIPLVPRRQLLDALAALARRHLIETKSAQFTQQPVVMEYVVEQLIEQVCDEISTAFTLEPPRCTLHPMALLQTHALLQAQAKDYVRESQTRTIVQPLCDRLLAILRSPQAITAQLNQVLAELRTQAAPGYGAGNVINLLQQLRVDLTGYDFSGLTVWQAYLQGSHLPQVNFAHADLRRSVFSETLGNVWAIAFSPDGEMFAAGDAAGEVHLWRTADRQRLITCQGHRHWVCAVAFSADGQTLVSASGDSTVKIWSVVTGKCLRTLEGHTDWLVAVACSPTAPLIASSGVDCTIRLWDAQTGACLQVFEGHQHWVCAIAFSPDGQTLVSASDDQTLKLWDGVTYEEKGTLTGHLGAIRAVAWSADGRTIASGSEDHTVRLWDAATGNCVHTLTEHHGEVRSVAFSPSGTLVASSSFDQTIKLWEVTTGQLHKTLTGHTDVVRAVAFHPHPSDLILASGSADQSLRFWNTQTGRCFKTVSGYTNFVLSVVFSPDGQTLASTSANHTIQLWQPLTGESERILRGHTNWVWSVAFSPDGQTLVSGSFDQTLRLWNRQTGHCQQILRGHTGWVWSVAFSPDGQTVVSGSFDQTLRLWDRQTGECQRVFRTPSRIWAIAISPDGHRLASGYEDHRIQIWQLATGDCRQTLRGHTGRINSLAFSADGRSLLSTSDDRSLRLWDLSSGESLVMHDQESVRSACFSPDGTMVVSGGFDKTVKLWNRATGECLKVLSGHTDRLWTVAYSPDGQWMVSGGEDETIRVWSAMTGECDRILRNPRPYEGMNITGATGLTEAERLMLEALGAVQT
jgi:WD40 repeat protein